MLADRVSEVGEGDYIVRASKDSPSLFAAGGFVCMPYHGNWIKIYSPNASRVIWRIAFSHLADDEVSPSQVKRFYCPACSEGELVIRRQKGEGWFLVCSNGPKRSCSYRRRLTEADAKLKVRLYGLKCSKNQRALLFEEA